ncbi:hypothetical protein H2198_008854 [Neophaeococcomyces mojaviensis]|uniref:Uncharacterized protein n=1 Tax=Neophaeococcomyces mojaviensis TaxID=3383035 RepID=A0ACC2ZWG9_9EURO|nr:hypothetical protein H2198_008854 [Knufia sp. JES_112]
MATEIAAFNLKDGKRPDDANSAAGQVLRDTLDTLTQQKGFQRAYWGREVENPDRFRLFVDWDSVDAHMDFTKTETYKPFLDRFSDIADLKNNVSMYHANLKPHPATEALSDHVSPATEILMVFFPADYSEADQKKFEDDLKKLVAVIEKEAKTYTASAGGWVVEEVDIPGTSEKGKAYQVLIGWQSVEAHLAFRETQPFKDNIHLLRGAKDLKTLAVTHYSGTQVTSGSGGVGDLGGGNMPDIQGEILNPQESGSKGPKTRADGTTTKNNDDLKGVANALHKERVGR